MKTSAVLLAVSATLASATYTYVPSYSASSIASSSYVDDDSCTDEPTYSSTSTVTYPHSSTYNSTVTSTYTHYSHTSYPESSTTYVTEDDDDCTEEPHTSYSTVTVPGTVTGTGGVYPTGTGGVYPTGGPNSTFTTHYGTPIPPTSTISQPTTIPTAGAATNGIGMLAIVGAAAVYFL